MFHNPIYAVLVLNSIGVWKSWNGASKNGSRAFWGTCDAAKETLKAYSRVVIRDVGDVVDEAAPENVIFHFSKNNKPQPPGQHKCGEADADSAQYEIKRHPEEGRKSRNKIASTASIFMIPPPPVRKTVVIHDPFIVLLLKTVKSFFLT